MFKRTECMLLFIWVWNISTILIQFSAVPTTVALARLAVLVLAAFAITFLVLAALVIALLVVAAT